MIKSNYILFLLKVFITTAVWSSFAYIWLFLVLVVITPNEVTLWEACITLLCFPVLVINSYMAEKNFFIGNKSDADVENYYDLCMLLFLLTRF